MALFGRKITKINTDSQKIEELLSRSVAQILPSKDLFRDVLVSGKRLKIYIGADATGPQLHLGHATNFMLLEKLRRLGHEVVILFGDFTAMIGDPTDKEALRKQLTVEQVNDHIQTWKEQVGKIVKFDDRENPARVLKNSSWLSKLAFSDILSLASNFTVQQMIERDMFEKRLKEQKPIYLHEFLYPLMQGYDSVAMNVDVEIGGTDQTFNMLAGRVLQKKINSKEKFVISTTLLENPKTGKKLMSKSEGSYIALNDSPDEMYGKTLALPDETLVQMFTDCTHLSLDEVETIKKALAGGENPKNIKMRLAREIVTLYYGEKLAQKAEENFKKTFEEGRMPDDVPSVIIERGSDIGEGVKHSGIVSSMSEWRRLIDEGAIEEVGGGKITNPKMPAERSLTLKIGKRRFVKINVE